MLGREELTAYDCNEGSYDSMGFPWQYKEMVYDKDKADKVMDAYESRIKELEDVIKVDDAIRITSLENEKEHLKERIKELEEENKHLENMVDAYQKSEALDIAKMNKKDERIKELEQQLSKWISVKDRLPNVGDFVLVCFADRAKSHYFPIDVVRWDSSYELQEISVTHWMPLPPPPTTEEN